MKWYLTDEKWYLTDENNTFIGTLDSSEIVKHLNTQPPRHNEKWSKFEKERFADALNDFIFDSAKKHGRTEIAIMSRIRKLIPKYY